jgi:hypothetical protein
MALALCEMSRCAADSSTFACVCAGHVAATSDITAEQRFIGAPGLLAEAGMDIVEILPKPIQPQVVGKAAQ